MRLILIFLILLFSSVFVSSSDWVRPEDNVQALINASVNGTQNYVSKFNGGFLLINSLIYDNGAFVGINTTTQQARTLFRVDGGTRIDGAVGINAQPSTVADLVINTNFAQPYIQLQKSGVKTMEFGTTITGDHLFYDAEQTGSNIYFRTKTNQIRLVADGTRGNIGIGSDIALTEAQLEVLNDDISDHVLLLESVVGQVDDIISAEDGSGIEVFSVENDGKVVINDDTSHAVYPALLTINKPSTTSGDFILFETNSSAQDVDGFTFYQTGGVQFQGIKMLKYVAENDASEDINLMTLTCANYDETDGTEDAQCSWRQYTNGVGETYWSTVAGRNVFYVQSYWPNQALMVDEARGELRVGSDWTNEDATVHIQGHSTTQAVLQLEGETGQSDPILRIGNDTMDAVQMEVFDDGKGWWRENVYYNVNSISNITTIVGTQSNINTCLDDTVINMSEKVVAPGMLANFTFTNVESFRNIVYCHRYDGNHDLHMSIYNYNTNSFIYLNDVGGTDVNNCNLKSIGGSDNAFISGGNVIIQLEHPQNGNTGHIEHIDCLRLER